MVKSVKTTEPANHIAVFQETSIRRVWHKEEWWFFVVDVCAILTASPDAGAYGRKLKQRETDCSNTVHPVAQGRAFQMLAGAGRLRTGEGNRKPRTGKRSRSSSVRGQLEHVLGLIEQSYKNVIYPSSSYFATCLIAACAYSMSGICHFPYEQSLYQRVR